MRRAAAVLAAVVLGAMTLAASTSAALASNGAATPFKISYEYGGTYTDCAGARVDNPVSVKDSETCLVTGDTSSMIPGTYSGHPTGYLPGIDHPALWQSDYDGQVALDWYVRVTDNGDGSFTMYAVAYFLYH